MLGKQKQKTFIRSEADIIEKLKNTAVKFNDLEADFEGKKVILVLMTLKITLNDLEGLRSFSLNYLNNL